MSRIGGVFPFPLQNPGTDGAITLASGGISLVPPGNYLLTTGDQTNCEWFDPNAQQWRGLNSDSSNMQWISSDGTNFRLVNMSGICIGALVTNAGSGATNGIGTTATGVTIAFGAPASGSTLATATGYPIVGGSVQAPTIVQGGSGFLVPPVIAIDPPPPGGVQASAYATISSAGVVNGIIMNNAGAGYASTPNFYVLPQPPNYQGSPIAGVAANAFPPPGLVAPSNLPGGSLYNPNISTGLGCLLTSNALTGSGTLTGIGILNYGATYDGTHIPTVTIVGCGAAAATAIMSMCLTSITLGSGGTGYGTTSSPIWETSLGLVTGDVGLAPTNPVEAAGVCTVSGGGVVTGFVIEAEGFGFQKVPVVSVTNTSALATGQATGTAVVGGIPDVSILQARVQ
jgi:hypothetical protein